MQLVDTAAKMDEEENKVSETTNGKCDDKKCEEVAGEENKVVVVDTTTVKCVEIETQIENPMMVKVEEDAPQKDDDATGNAQTDCVEVTQQENDVNDEEDTGEQATEEEVRDVKDEGEEEEEAAVVEEEDEDEEVTAAVEQNDEEEQDGPDKSSDANAAVEVEEEEEVEKPECSLLKEALKGHKEPAAENSTNKMEDVVHEGSGDTQQPSSPGHAEQRDLNNVNEPCKTEDLIYEDEDDEEEGLVMTNAGSNDKRKNAEQLDDDAIVAKRLKTDIHMQELYLRNKILNDYTDSIDTGSVSDMDNQVEQLEMEIQNLDELAKEKEREWNKIIHAKKLKEEILMRVHRQKQVCLLSNGLEISENHDFGSNLTLHNHKQRRLNNNASNKAMEALMNGIEGSKGRKGPVRDVQSIIADYRQQHPESVPRRGRRIRNVNGNADMKGSGVMSFANAALGSGARVRHNLDAGNDVSLFITSTGENYSGKDAVLADIEADHLMFPKKDTYPEVTVHAVQASPPTMTNNVSSSSLLHGILTKSNAKQESSSSSSNNSRTTFSPTLARLLTAPDKTSAANAQQSNHLHHSNSSTKLSNVSISDILSTNKGRSEITITPVGNDYADDVLHHQQHLQHLKRDKLQMEDETEDSVDRLVIDESTDLADSRTDNNSDDGAGDEVPQCQGCNQKAAQFVCAGCSNQWYCSRECQVSAWDEHSETCSG